MPRMARSDRSRAAATLRRTRSVVLVAIWFPRTFYQILNVKYPIRDDNRTARDRLRRTHPRTAGPVGDVPGAGLSRARASHSRRRRRLRAALDRRPAVDDR